MCEMVSWIEVEKEGKKNVLFLTNDEVFSERGKKMLKECQDNDFLGHHAIRYIWDMKGNEGVQRENRNLWETKNLPKEIQAQLHDFASFKKNFGKMMESYAQQDDLEYIVDNAPTDKKWHGLKKFCKDILKDLSMRDVKTEVLEVNVRYDLSVDELIKLNKFGWKDDCVTSQNYPSRKRPAKKQELVLVSMGANASTKDVLKTMKVLKLKAGNPISLLSLVLDHPNRQKESPIVALGQTWRGSDGLRRVPYAWVDYGGRRLDLGYFGNDWRDDCRFLAVRNS